MVEWQKGVNSRTRVPSTVTVTVKAERQLDQEFKNDNTEEKA